MKTKNGFTLIEVLAVIAIIALIATMTIPLVLNAISESKKGTTRDSAHGIVETAKNYFFKYDEEENWQNFSCSFPNNCTNLEYNGITPTRGNIRINEIGLVYGEITYEDNFTYCIFENEVYTGTCSETISTELSNKVKEKGKRHIYKEDGSIDIEKIFNCIEYDIEVKDETKVPFCVIDETENEVTLISKTNYYNEGKTWDIFKLYSDLNYDTRDWDNISVIDKYSYTNPTSKEYKTIDITDGIGTIVGEDNSEYSLGSNELMVKARLITAEEANKIINGTTNMTDKTQCNKAPSWLNNVWTSTYYRTTTNDNESYKEAYLIKNLNNNCGITTNTVTDTYEIRPVIKVNKNNL